jgi:hypothetical protein
MVASRGLVPRIHVFASGPNAWMGGVTPRDGP